MAQYRDDDNPLSPLLLRAVILAGSRAHNGPELFNSDRSPSKTVDAMYSYIKRHYATANDHPVTIVQVLILITWHCSGTIEDALHWTSIAVTIAKANNLHQHTPELAIAQIRLQKRIFWTLFTLDQSIATHLGSPAVMDMADCSTESICAEDFIESDDQTFGDLINVYFFLQYIELYVILSQQCTHSPQIQSNSSTITVVCNVALED